MNINYYKNKLAEYDSTYLNEDQKNTITELLTFAIKSNKIGEYELDELFKLLTQRVKTGFTFDEVPKVFKGIISVPKESLNKEIKSFNGSNDGKNLNHLLFIGENYDILKNLLITHKEKINVIYIDPPYNTDSAKTDGNFLSEDKNIISSTKFVYNDKFSRTGWLNMLKQRLELAKDLLASDGVIFVSIDDNEQAYLKVLMDEIFGEQNFICNFIWKKSAGGKHDTKLIAIDTEFILAYSKNKNLIKFNGKKNDIAKYKYEDEKGFYNLEQLDRGSLSYHKSLDYIITDEKGQKYYPKNYNDYLRRQDGITTIKDWCWRWSETKLKNEKDRIVFRNEKVFTKTYYDKDKRIPYRNMIDSPNNRNANDEIKSLFNSRIFSYPKPTKLIKHLINLVSNNDIVLDFFAGSGTTGHAVLELNQEDGKKRQFILATNNEQNIAQNITYERLYRVIKGEGTKGEKDFSWIKNKPFSNNNLKVFELNKKEVSANQKFNKDVLEIINEYKKINPNFKLNKQEEIFYKLSSLEQTLNIEGKNEIN